MTHRTSYVMPTGIEIIDGEVVTGVKSDPLPESTGNPKLDAWAAVRQEWKRHGPSERLAHLEQIAKAAEDTRYAHPVED